MTVAVTDGSMGRTPVPLGMIPVPVGMGIMVTVPL